MIADPEVSVIMANYNGGRHLDAAIGSLKAQTLQRWELLFADDGSQDDSIERAKRHASGDGRIRVIEQHLNRGPAAARNSAIAFARGRWIAIFDSDDLMRPRRLETLRARALSDGAAIVLDNLLVFSDESGATKSFIPAHIVAKPVWIDLATYIRSNCLFSRMPNLGYLKPFIDARQFSRSGVVYDEALRIGEDYNLIARLLASGLRLRLEPSALYLYRKHAHSISYRIGSDAIAAMMDADDRLSESFAVADKKVMRALRKRRQSLNAMLEYDHVLQMLKSGRYGAAAAAGLRTPGIWPLLARPVWTRIARLGRRANSAWLQAALERE